MGALAIPLAVGSAVVGTGLQAYGSAMAGREQARAANFEAQQYRVKQEQARTAAAQAEARRREDLTASLETIQAIRAGRGVGLSSPTGMAILEDEAEGRMRDMRTERLNLLLQSDQARMAGEFARRRAKTSLLAGNLGAVGAVVDGVGRVADIFRGMPNGGNGNRTASG